MFEVPSPNCDERPGGIDVLVLHYTGMQTGQAAIDRLRDPAARVSSHYVVEEDGRIFRLVPEHLRAWHAGVSIWRGRPQLNDVSIGIEIVNPGHEWGYRPFPAAQIAAVIALSRGILTRHPIPARNVVAHSDIAPTRKQDPGELFPWAELAAAGIGLWADVPGADVPAEDVLGADGAPADEAALLGLLGRLGYGLEEVPAAAVIAAFQRHWRPEAVTGTADAGTVARARALVEIAAA